MNKNFHLSKSILGKSTLLVICNLIAIQLFSQVPDNLNFLNHNARNQAASEVILFDDHLVAADHLGFDKVMFGYKLKDYDTDLAADFKFIQIDENTVGYASWYFDCGDCFIDELRTNVFRNDSIIRDTYGGFDNLVNNVYDITNDTLGGWWCLVDEGSELLHLKDGEILSRIDLNIFNPQQIFTSCNGDVYIIHNNYLGHLVGEELGFDYEMEAGYELHTQDGYNYLLRNTHLYKYNCDMSEQLNEWTLPSNVPSFKSLTINEDDFVDVSVIADSGYEITRIDSMSNVVNVYNGNVELNETISGIKVTSDDTHLIYGQHKFELGDYTFYRNIHHSDQLEYPTMDASISNFTLTYESGSSYEVDWMNGIVNVYPVQPNIRLENKSDQSLYALNLFSSDYSSFNYWVPTSNFRYRLSEEIPSNNIEDIGLYGEPTALEELQDVSIELVGANYKFLKDGSIVINSDVISSLNEYRDIQELDVYPNPTNDVVNVTYGLDDDVYVLNHIGEVVEQVDGSITDQAVDVSDLYPGTYLVVVRNKEGVISVAKFVKL